MLLKHVQLETPAGAQVKSMAVQSALARPAATTSCQDLSTLDTSLYAMTLPNQYR